MVHAGLEALDAQQSKADFPLVCVCYCCELGSSHAPAAAAVVRPHVMSFDNVVLFVQATFEHALASGGRCGIARTRKLGIS